MAGAVVGTHEHLLKGRPQTSTSRQPNPDNKDIGYSDVRNANLTVPSGSPDRRVTAPRESTDPRGRQAESGQNASKQTRILGSGNRPVQANKDNNQL